MIRVDGVVIASAGDTFSPSSLASAALFVFRRDPSAFAIALGSGPSVWARTSMNVHTSALSNQDHLVEEVSVCFQNHILAFHSGCLCDDC